MTKDFFLLFLERLEENEEVLVVRGAISLGCWMCPMALARQCKKIEVRWACNVSSSEVFGQLSIGVDVV